jgi:hypothetical protein
MGVMISAYCCAPFYLLLSHISQPKVLDGSEHAAGELQRMKGDLGVVDPWDFFFGVSKANQQ